MKKNVTVNKNIGIEPEPVKVNVTENNISTKRIKMISSSIGINGVYYAGKEYEVNAELASCLIRNGEAKEC